MNRTPKIAVMAVIGVMTVAGCGGEQTTPSRPAVPPAEAYPRMSLPEADSLVAVDGTVIEVNPSAVTVTEPTGDRKATAVTVTYPDLGAHIYYTVRSVTAAEMESAVDNRLERMSLNLGGIPAQTEHTSADSPLEGVILTARSGSQTPVQLLVVGNDFVVSGTAFIDDAHASTRYDSIRPLVDMLYDDMVRAVPSAHFVKQ